MLVLRLWLAPCASIARCAMSCAGRMFVMDPGSCWSSASMYVRATGDSPLPPSTPLSCTMMPTIDANTKPARAPTSTVPAAPLMSRDTPIYQAVYACTNSF